MQDIYSFAAILNFSMITAIDLCETDPRNDIPGQDTTPNTIVDHVKIIFQYLRSRVPDLY